MQGHSKCAHPSPTLAFTSTPRTVHAEKRRKLLPQPTTPTPLPPMPTMTRMTHASKRKSLGGDEEPQLKVEQPMMVSTRKKKMRKDELDMCLEQSKGKSIDKGKAKAREEPVSTSAPPIPDPSC
ncbi:uncharacterized protein LACBIDRAFT_313341 [Laccaria bicolor S238N-H82]|uniref:Predicted protein n=1 Tax=Laccaria bicolor (strain S238N-H82 / ATCC MYA-4686) TaxID=486041 RepID=B0DY36_LACBS|nr:uncharacterized protein LACBIDRAFT_313341 [Laccaria bicolor S238N-H82]EDR00449.1 predicted protein [Laccaria bicolor S238N-H82]|eukprot:XP_001888841.1 predicted protein [Laccaria bicolor S238N-H82]